MEQMTQDLNVENLSLSEIKKLYNSSIDSNVFLNIYTLSDVEFGKKKTFEYLLKKYNYRNQDRIQSFIKESSDLLAKDLFSKNNVECNITKNAIGPNISQKKELSTYQRIITIDSKYTEDLSNNNTNINVELNDTLDDVVSLELSNICIPYSFYNISSSDGNNFFYINDTRIELEDGYYKEVSNIIEEINNKIEETSVDLSFTDIVSGKNKTSITTTSDTASTITFYDSSGTLFVNTKINTNLGWILGFRNIEYYQKDDMCGELDGKSKITYEVTSSASVPPEKICYIPCTKYFTIIVDDINKTQSNNSLVQISNTFEQINRKKMHQNPSFLEIDDASLNCILEDESNNVANVNTVLNNRSNSFSRTNNNSSYYGMTKNQIYSMLQQTRYKQNLTKVNESKLISNLVDNVFAIVPFETKSLEWGKSLFTSDKNKFIRKYNTPVNISKLNIKILNDLGNELDLNGADWSFTIISKHQHQS